jgi:hypothetical protein
MEFKKFMRIISSIFLVVLIFSNSISKPKYSFGLYCGGGISKNIITSNIGKPNYFAVPAISVGLNAEAKISKNWGFKIDPNYLKLGYSYNITFTDLNGKVLSKDKLNVSLNYFQNHILYFQKSFQPYLVLPRIHLNSGDCLCISRVSPTHRPEWCPAVYELHAWMNQWISLQVNGK